MINIYILSFVFGIAFLVIILELVRKNKLLEKYSLYWILFGIILLILSSTPLFIERISKYIGVVYAPSILFLFGLLFLIIYNLHITVVFSKQSQKITKLAQELAILKEKSIKLTQDGDNNVQ